jgi:predicted permease
MSHVAVLSYGFWGRQFGRDPSIVGRSVRLSDEPYMIVGVMPAEFFGIDRASVPDLWVPFAREPNTRFAWVIGRLRPGVTVEGARAALEPVFKRSLESLARWFVRSTDQERKSFMAQRLLVNRATEGTSIVRWSYWSYHNTLKILLALTGLVLVIACVNLANLLMARSAGRSREIGIRLAVGAGRWRVARQLMTENLLLSLAGAALGVAAAGWGHRLLLGYLMRDPAGAALDYQLDLRLIGFGLLAAVATSILFGLLPAIRATRMDLSSAIRAGGHGGGKLNLPVAKVMLAAEIGLSMVLLVGAALFARSLRNLGSADLGLAREDLLLVDVRPSTRAPDARWRFWDDVSTRIAALPGVRSVAVAGDAVFGNGGWRQTVWIERPGQEPQWLNVADNLVSAGFFATTGIPLLAGREIGEQDRDGAPPVVVVNRTFAQRAFGDGNPIGRRIGDRGAVWAGRQEIVGVVADAKYGEVREKALPMVFHPMAQGPSRASYVLHVRTAAPKDLGPAVRREILAADDAALIGELRTVPQILRAQLREDRMFASLAAFFAGLALALGAIGIYGVISYRVARRTAEIGVRVALGAGRGDVVWLVLREAALLLAIGIAVGGPAAVAAARLVKSVLFGLEPLDPPALAAAAILLLAAGCLAGYLPARRAASIEPTDALRAD